MGMHNSKCHQHQYTMKVFAFTLVLALSIQDIFGWGLEDMASQEEIDAFTNVICKCDAPIPQWTNSIYNAAEPCMNDEHPDMCIGKALGLINDDGSEITPLEAFQALHGGSEEMDAYLDSCYSQAFDNNETSEAATVFGQCMELAIADMCDIEIPAGAVRSLASTNAALNRDLCIP